MSFFEETLDNLRDEPKTWLITGVAGFIGSNLLEALLRLNQRVVGLDNFATGHERNLHEVEAVVSQAQWENFQFLQGDIRDIEDCHAAMYFRPGGAKVTQLQDKNPVAVDYVLHEAALGSVPRSINDPILTNSTNIDGFLNILVAARDAGVKSFTYAASSSTYGDHPGLPKVEDVIGKPLSPYAVTKYVNELYAEVFARTYNFACVGLRYFNVFGKRQDPNGGYAAVIPKWISAQITGDKIFINGDGETSRDFCYIENVVQANILAATANLEFKNSVYNVAVGGRTTLNKLIEFINQALLTVNIVGTSPLEYRDFRAGDVKHSQADIGKAQKMLGYHPHFDVQSGLTNAVAWYVDFIKNSKAQ